MFHYIVAEAVGDPGFAITILANVESERVVAAGPIYGNTSVGDHSAPFRCSLDGEVDFGDVYGRYQFGTCSIAKARIAIGETFVFTQTEKGEIDQGVYRIIRLDPA